MNKLINKLFNIFSISSILFLIIGIILTLFPGISLSIISYTIATILFVLGLSLINNKSKVGFSSSFSVGILILILSIVILISPNILTNIIPIVLGLIIILRGISRVNLAIIIKNAGNDNWISSLVIAILNIICGVILLTNPSWGAITIASLIGIILIIYSVSDLIDVVIIKKKIKDFTNIFKH